MSSDGYRFERRVADLYRALGSQVRHDVSLAGNQIDVVVAESGSAATTRTRAVECKAYARPVGATQVRTFAVTAELLKGRKLIDAATVVSRVGFTRDARLAAENFDVELLEIADLEARLAHAGRPAPSALPGAVETSSESERNAFNVFVAMPLDERYDDVYLLGISAAAELAGISVDRAGETIESSEIIEDIKARIVACDLLLADTTEANLNVYYELGFADGFGKQVLLIARNDVQLPFDIQGRRHLLYPNISSMRQPLADRFKAFRDRRDAAT